MPVPESWSKRVIYRGLSLYKRKYSHSCYYWVNSKEHSYIGNCYSYTDCTELATAYALNAMSYGRIPWSKFIIKLELRQLHSGTWKLF